MLAFSRQTGREITYAQSSATLSGASASTYHSHSHGTEEEEENKLSCHLRQCSKSMDLSGGRLLHHHLIFCGLEADMFLSNLVLQMYGKCKVVSDAISVFWGMHCRDVFTWTFIISAYRHAGHDDDAELLFHRMHLEAMAPSKFTVMEILGVSANGLSAVIGKRVHSCIGANSDLVTLNALINHYGKSRNVEAAERVFDGMEERDVVTWNTMLTMYNQLDAESAITFQCFQCMLQEDVIPNKVTYSCVSDACVRASASTEATKIHAVIVGSGLNSDVNICNTLICMYAKCDKNLINASSVFHAMTVHDVISWTSLIAASAQQSLGDLALMLFGRMQMESELPNNITFLNVINACANNLLEQGRRLHARVGGSSYEMDVTVGNSLIYMYGKCGNTVNARNTFDKMHSKDRISWNSIISAYAQQGHTKEALGMFREMHEDGMNPDRATIVTVLEACSHESAVNKGKQLHSHIKNSFLEVDSVIGTALVNFYGKCGSLQDAQEVFGNATNSSVVLWTAMASAYVQHRRYDCAIQFFEQMKQEGIVPDKLAFSTILSACLGQGALLLGKRFHTCILGSSFKSEVTIDNALMSMYGRCGSLIEAGTIFKEMMNPTVVSWTAIMSACNQSGKPKQAFHYYEKMVLDGIRPNKMTFATLLDACASLAALTEGNNFYKQLLIDGIDPDVILATALINLYSRCGCIEDARRVFDRMPKQNVASWNCIIAAYHRQGDVNQVHNLFKLMQKEKIRPDEITFLSIVSSFSHAGLVDEAYNYLNSMVHNHGLTPTVEHYNCMIDLLGRAGCLDQVEEMLVGSPFEATLHSCMSSLNACRVHLDVERGKRVMESITKFTPANNASKVLMSNIYAAANQFQEASLSRAA